MKKFPLYLSIVLLIATAFSSNLTAQTYKQRVRSAELLRQILPPELKVTADNVRRATQKDVRAAITAAGYEPDYAAALEDILIPAKVIDWRALIVELTSDCGERISYAIFFAEDEIHISMLFPPGKKCEKLYLKMVELGLVYPFEYPFIDKDYNVCLTKKCIPSYTGDCCWNIIYGVPNGTECPEPTCEPGSCKGCEMEIDGGYLGDLFMDK